MIDYPRIFWNEEGKEKCVRWRSENGTPPPKKLVIADDHLKGEDAYRFACEGTALLWRGDFQNARQLLQALARRIDKKARKIKNTPMMAADSFHLNRQFKLHRARILGMLLLPFEQGHRIPLRRAPDVANACSEVYGLAAEPYIASLRGLQGIIGAYEWRKKGVEIPTLPARIHPYYGVFSPVRGEYVCLVNETPLPKVIQSKSVAFDIGTGTGVLAAILAQRGINRIVATDQDTRAIQCANENISRLGFSKVVEVVVADLFPQGRASLIVCNPPWLPARPSSPLEHAIFDPDSRMLQGYLKGLAEHLESDGEGWLILSDLAEHFGLRTREELLASINGAGLKILGKIDTKPHHPRVSDTNDPLHQARAAEVTSLWRLAVI